MCIRDSSSTRSTGNWVLTEASDVAVSMTPHGLTYPFRSVLSQFTDGAASSIATRFEAVAHFLAADAA